MACALGVWQLTFTTGTQFAFFLPTSAWFKLSPPLPLIGTPTLSVALTTVASGVRYPNQVLPQSGALANPRDALFQVAPTVLPPECNAPPVFRLPATPLCVGTSFRHRRAWTPGTANSTRLQTSHLLTTRYHGCWSILLDLMWAANPTQHSLFRAALSLTD